MDRSEASGSTYPESTAGPASPIFGTASFSTFTTTALTSLWPGSSRRNQSSSYCASDGNSVVEDHHRDAIAGVVDNRSDSSLTYNHHSGYSRSTSSVTERERNTLSSSSLTASYHVRSSTDPYTSPSTPAPSARTQSFTPSTLTPSTLTPSTLTPSTPSHSRATNSYSDSTPTRHSASISYPTTLSSSQLHTPSTSQPSTSTRDLIAMYEQRAGRSSPLPFSSSTGIYTRSGPIARPDSPLKSPSTTTQSASVPPVPGYLPRSLRGTTVDSRSSGARSEVSAWSFGSGSDSQTHARSQSQTDTRSGRAPSRPSSPSKSAVSGWSYSTSSGGGGGIIGAITGFVGLSGGRSAYSSSGRTSSPSRSYTRRSRSTSRSGRSPFSTARRRTSTSPPGRGKERARSTGRRSPSRTTRIESETTTEDLGVVEPEEQAELVYEAPLWYYNVHRLSDYTWQRGHAQLYPHMLVVRWSEASGLIAEVKLDLLSCVEIRTVRPSGTERDIRVEVEREDGRRESMRLMTFELGYSDSLERLGGETRSAMVAWFEAIQCAPFHLHPACTPTYSSLERCSMETCRSRRPLLHASRPLRVRSPSPRCPPPRPPTATRSSR
ncbi:hypothetical protein PHLGIDRAFT_408118 [Phlebiopsis gigantea 11061_1 CR5-6]|uniref:PH domain-containing protein n=1 Tax=Phlebiopsis gigantea (strain 11061_1 CR5-6) TaxID=745531 RepID=A0A0C3RZF6_PHLG1|nr:hypothetical protein PHLGIDRAFT_408118 [Phlebiopsis gigantea 11061_1 CR5-6]